MRQISFTQICSLRTFIDVCFLKLKPHFFRQVFVGNVETNNDPVLSFLEIPVKAQVIRVVPTAKGSGAANWCMRVELYGHHSGI